MEFPGRGWSEKASRFAALLRALARVYTLEVDGRASSWRAALDPQVTQPTLVPLDGPKVSGTSRRPRWMSGSTPLVVAANVWRALNPAPVDSEAGVSKPGPDDRERVRATRTFAHNHRIDRSGIVQNVVWRTRAERELALSREAALRAYYDAIDKWQKDPKGPMPIHPNNVTAATRARLRPPSCGDQGNAVDAAAIASRVVPSSSSCASTSSATLSDRRNKKGEKSRKAAPCTARDAVTTSCTAISPSGTPTAPSSSPSSGFRDLGLASSVTLSTVRLATSTASSSCGDIAAPFIATSLRELRLRQQEDAARAIQAADTLIRADANGEAHGAGEPNASEGMENSPSFSEKSRHTAANHSRIAQPPPILACRSGDAAS